ncbi:twin-arginine translocation signal domain-containing protein [Bosea sp. 117]|uniref:twin-arginine translocation signal domain-containing protein n=1 Tax=Bosea sp. 117 TaxID=1125973 RepID=UPI000493CBE4|nr:twin-arginine translocation signal domain-containing protein [Bosea sp. 117]
MDRRSFLTGLAGTAGIVAAGAAGISMLPSAAEATPLDQLRALSGRRRELGEDPRATNIDDGLDGEFDADAADLAYGAAPDGTPVEQVWHHRRRRVCRWYWRRGVRVRRCWWVRW